MTEEEVTEALLGINSIHGSLTETNAMTFVIFREQYRHKLCDEQMVWVNDKIDRLITKATKDFKRNVDKMDKVASVPLVEKMEDHGTMHQIE